MLADMRAVLILLLHFLVPSASTQLTQPPQLPIRFIFEVGREVVSGLSDDGIKEIASKVMVDVMGREVAALVSGKFTSIKNLK